jgi:hypothetical protein
MARNVPSDVGKKAPDFRRLHLGGSLHKISARPTKWLLRAAVSDL